MMKINRRSLIAAVPEGLRWFISQTRWYKTYVVQKGQYKASFSKPISNNIIPAKELLALVVMDLEYGKETIKKIWAMSETERNAAWEKFKRCDVTIEEMKEIYAVIKC